MEVAHSSSAAGPLRQRVDLDFPRLLSDLSLLHDLRIVRVLHDKIEHSFGVKGRIHGTQLLPIVSSERARVGVVEVSPVMRESLEEVLHLFAGVVDLEDVDNAHEVDLAGLRSRLDAAVVRVE